MNEWNYPQDGRPRAGRKSKWLAGLLAFLIPGTGHFYLGQMIKGIAVMLLIAVDICAIVFAAVHLQNVMMIVLPSLCMPIIYFYNLFDAIQSTDTVNERRFQAGLTPPHAGWTPPQAGIAPEPGPMDPPFNPQSSPRSIDGRGLIWLAVGTAVLLAAANIGWTHGLFHSSASMIGAVLLIGAGIGLWIWENKGEQGRRG